MSAAAAVSTPGVARLFEGDAELAGRMLSGDESAFDSFYAANVGRVYALALRMSGDPHRARSITQDVFVRAWERIGAYRGESRLSSWLHRIAVNLVLERSRRRSRWRRLLLPDESGESAPDARGGDVGLQIDLERAIAVLPPGARQMLVLRDIEGYSYEEISQLTGAAMGTVKAQIHRARRLVKEMMGR